MNVHRTLMALPDPIGQMRIQVQLAEGGNFVVPVWRSMYERHAGRQLRRRPGADYIPPFESPELQSGTGQEIPAQHRLTQAARVPEQANTGNASDKQRARANSGYSSTPPTPRTGNREGQLVRCSTTGVPFSGPAALDDALMPGWWMANVGHWQNKSSGRRSTRSRRPHCSLGFAGVYSDNLVDVEKITEPSGSEPVSGRPRHGGRSGCGQELRDGGGRGGRCSGSSTASTNWAPGTGRAAGTRCAVGTVVALQHSIGVVIVRADDSGR